MAISASFYYISPNHVTFENPAITYRVIYFASNHIGGTGIGKTASNH